MNRDVTVIHLLPCDGIGGVEIAANTMRRISVESIDFDVKYILSEFYDTKSRKIYNPFYFLLSSIHLIRACPDVLIVSLWRAYVVGVIVKVFKPRIRLVTFLHLAKDVHVVDRMATVAAMRVSDEVWADSLQTLGQRLDGVRHRKSRVISFVTKRITPLECKGVRDIFIYWGRINEQKNLCRALRLFKAIRSRRPAAKYIIIGPDGGALCDIQRRCTSLGLEESVHFVGSCSFEEIRRYANGASFYLQTSLVEGMAMSVVEAMQLGLVPIVTPVGEIESYARNKQNAVVVTDDDVAVADVIALLTDDHRYQGMRQEAISTWKNQPLYKDSVLDACRDMFEMEDIS